MAAIFLGLYSHEISKENKSLKIVLSEKSNQLIHIKDSLNRIKLSMDTILTINPFFNRIACFMAGVVPDDYDRKDSLFRNPEWLQYAMKIDENWNKFEKGKLEVVENWVKENLPDISKKSKNVFYPFSGPDFNYCYRFFPNAEKYIFIGLEPVGKIPSIEKLHKDSLIYFFYTLNQSIYASVNFSYFITKQMLRQFRNPRIDGSIPIFMFFLARNGMIIENISPVGIDSTGAIVSRDTSANKYTVDKKFRNGVEFTFYKKNSRVPVKLYYYSMNLINQSIDNNKSENAFISHFDKNVSTFLKSASFLLHNRGFEKIRDMILAKSKYIIQDDSGVPFRNFDTLIWVRHFYGAYIPPIPTFKAYYQADLQKHFKSEVPVPFKFGYSLKPAILVMVNKALK